MTSHTLNTITTAHNQVEIKRVGKRIDMDVEGATFASWHPDYYLTGYSWDAVTAGCLLHPTTPTSILMLGLAGGTVARQLRRLLPKVQITAIEIDSDLVELARTYMELDQQQVQVEIADAYNWLQTCSTLYDVVIDDLYLSGCGDVERTLAPTGKYLKLLKKRLAPTGLVAANMIADGQHLKFCEETVATFHNEFASVAEIASPKGYNHIVIGGNRLANPTTTLSTFTACFPTQRDRDWWQRLHVHGL